MSTSAKLGEKFVDLLVRERLEAEVEKCVDHKLDQEQRRIALKEVTAANQGWSSVIKEDARDYIQNILANCEEEYGVKATKDLKNRVDAMFDAAFKELIRRRRAGGSKKKTRGNKKSKIAKRSNATRKASLRTHIDSVRGGGDRNWDNVRIPIKRRRRNTKKNKKKT